MAATTFPRFLNLPQELQDLIWHHATENAKRYRTFFISLGFYSYGEIPSPHPDTFFPFPVNTTAGTLVFYNHALIRYGLFAVKRALASSREAFYEWWKEELEATQEPEREAHSKVRRDVVDVLGKLILKLWMKREAKDKSA